MAPSAKDGRCCICGKKKRTHPGTTLHLFPKDGKRRMKWIRALNIAYERDSTAICGDHFAAMWHGSKGRLLKNAIPNLPDGFDRRGSDGVDEQGPGAHLEEFPEDTEINASDMDTAHTSEEHPLNYSCDSTNFGVLSLNSIDHQDSRLPEASIRTATSASLAEDDMPLLDIGADRDESNIGSISQKFVPDHQEIHVGESSFKTRSVTESSFKTPSLTESSFKTPSLTESSFKTPSLTESSFKTPTPTESSFKTPTPTESSFKTPTPTESSFKTPTPTESSFKAPTPTESSFKTPSLTESSFKTPTPTESSFKTPTPTESSFKTPTPTESSFKTPTPTESSFKTPTPIENDLLHADLGGGKCGCSEGCRCNKCYAAEETGKKTEATKSITQQTYPGPIRRQVVRTSSGDKRTIMIVNKASLKNLQARGLIKPITKYMTKQPHAVQSLKKEVIQHSSVRADNPSKISQFDDLLPLKEADTSRRSSSIPTTQPATDEHCDSESCTESRHELHASSHTSQMPKLQPLNQETQAPVRASWAPVVGPNSLFTMTDILPTGVITLPGTRSEYMQRETPLLNTGINCTVNQPNSQVRDPMFSSHMADNPSPNNSGISLAQRLKASQEGDKELTYNRKYPAKKQSGTDHDYCSSITTNSTNNSSTATFTHKHPNPKSVYVIIPSLLNMASSENKITHCIKDPEEIKKEDQPIITCPKNRDSIKCSDLPSVSVHQLKSSSSGALEQVQQAGFTRKCQLSNTTLHTSEQPSILHRVPPITPLDHQDKRLSLPPPYSPYRSANKELKFRYTRLLNKHRARYYVLLRKYKSLEQKIAIAKDVGTPQQIIRDAQKFLSEEHILFLESQMFLKNRAGKGNRFSRKFMKLMIEYYKRSAAGYKYLRTIFTIPTVGTIKKCLDKPIDFRD